MILKVRLSSVLLDELREVARKKKVRVSTLLTIGVCEWLDKQSLDRIRQHKQAARKVRKCPRLDSRR